MPRTCWLGLVQWQYRIDSIICLEILHTCTFCASESRDLTFSAEEKVGLLLVDIPCQSPWPAEVQHTWYTV